MSEEKITELESLLKKLIGLGWTSLVSVVVIAFAFGGWVASLELRAQEASNGLEHATSLLHALDSFRIETQANRYTSGDALKMNGEIQSMITGHDKRVTRLEDSLVRIDKSLERIENKLASKP